MATSPNYGWLEPDNTDLVKNGALAIRTLGNAIDTTMATMTPKSLVDAKGDLIAASAADTPARLAVGNNGETLVADSSTSTGLRYNPTTGNLNFAVNGNFDIWQRGTSFVNPATNAYTADRWATIYTVNQTTSRQTTGVPAGSTYCARFTYTGAGAIAMQCQALEAGMAKMLAGKTVTISVKVRRNASFSTSLNLTLRKNATADTLAGGTWTDIATTTASNAQLPTGITSADWYTLTLTTTIPNDGTANGLSILVAESATGSSGAYWEMAQVKLEIGSVATAMTLSGGTIQGELAACKRYLPSYDNTAGTNNGFVSGYAYGTNSSIFMVPFDVAARVSPTGMTVSGTINAYALNTATGVTPTFDAGGINSAGILASHTITAGQGARLGITSGAKLLFTGCEL